MPLIFDGDKLVQYPDSYLDPHHCPGNYAPALYVKPTEEFPLAQCDEVVSDWVLFFTGITCPPNRFTFYSFAAVGLEIVDAAMALDRLAGVGYCRSIPALCRQSVR